MLCAHDHRLEGQEAEHAHDAGDRIDMSGDDPRWASIYCSMCHGFLLSDVRNLPHCSARPAVYPRYGQVETASADVLSSVYYEKHRVCCGRASNSVCAARLQSGVCSLVLNMHEQHPSLTSFKHPTSTTLVAAHCYTMAAR